MLRLGHVGDLHLTEGPRFADTLACLEFVVADGAEQGVQLWLVGGDLAGTTVPHRATILERNTLAALFQKMADTAPVIIVSGNHDAPADCLIYGKLDGLHSIAVREKPDVLEVRGARVFAFPYAWKRDWMPAVGSAEEKDRGAEAGIRELLASWRPQVEDAHADATPCVFLGHVTIGGSAIAGGEVMPPGQEIELAVSDIEALGVDYAGCSHIHLAQSFGAGRIWYPGSPSRSNFGETDPKGYVIVDVEPGRPPVVHRRLTPARPFVTVEATWALDAGDGTPGWILDALDEPALAGAEVRVRVTVPEEAAATCPVDDLVERFRNAGAVDVKPERRTVPKQALRCPEIVAATSLEQQLRAYWASLPTAPDEPQIRRALANLALLQRGEQLALEAA